MAAVSRSAKAGSVLCRDGGGSQRMFGNRGLFVFRRKKTEPDPDFSGGLYGEHHETEAGRDETVRRKEEAERSGKNSAGTGEGTNPSAYAGH